MQLGIEGAQCILLGETSDGEVSGSWRATEADVGKMLGIFGRQDHPGEAIPAAVFDPASDLIRIGELCTKEVEATGGITHGQIIVEVGQSIGKIFRNEGAIGGCVVGVEGIEPTVEESDELCV